MSRPQFFQDRRVVTGRRHPGADRQWQGMPRANRLMRELAFLTTLSPERLTPSSASKPVQSHSRYRDAKDLDSGSALRLLTTASTTSHEWG